MITEARVKAALPSYGFIRNYVLSVENWMDSPLAFQVGGALSCLSQTVPVQMQVRLGARLYGTSYTLLVGASGEARKSTACYVARDLLKDAIPLSLSEEPGSHEGLVESLRAQQRQIVMYPEFADFLSKSQKGYLNPLRTMYTSLWDCAPVGRALKGSRGKTVEDPRWSMLCGCTLDYLENHTEEPDWKGGFMGRFLTLLTDRERDMKQPPAIRDGWDSLVNDLKALTIPVIPGQWIGFSSEAEEYWLHWQNTYYAEAKTRTPSATASAISRCPAQALKVAMLAEWDLGGSRTGEPWVVGLEALKFALAVVEWHCESSIVLGERLAPNKDMKDRRVVLGLIGNVPISLGEISKEAKLLKRRTGEILETLVEQNEIGVCTNIGLAGTHYIKVEASKPGAEKPSIVLSTEKQSTDIDAIARLMSGSYFD